MLRRLSKTTDSLRSRVMSAEHYPTTSTVASWGLCHQVVGRKTLVLLESIHNARSSSRTARRAGPTWIFMISFHPTEKSSLPRSPSRPILSQDATASSSTLRLRLRERLSERWTTRKSRGGTELLHQGAALMAATLRTARRPKILLCIRFKSPASSPRGSDYSRVKNRPARPTSTSRTSRASRTSQPVTAARTHHQKLSSTIVISLSSSNPSVRSSVLAS